MPLQTQGVITSGYACVWSGGWDANEVKHVHKYVRRLASAFSTLAQRWRVRWKSCTPSKGTVTFVWGQQEHRLCHHQRALLLGLLVDRTGACVRQTVRDWCKRWTNVFLREGCLCCYNGFIFFFFLNPKTFRKQVFLSADAWSCRDDLTAVCFRIQWVLLHEVSGVEAGLPEGSWCFHPPTINSLLTFRFYSEMSCFLPAHLYVAVHCSCFMSLSLFSLSAQRDLFLQVFYVLLNWTLFR